MSLRFGRQMVSIPGPSTIPDRVLNAMNRPMPDIYGPELTGIVYDQIDRLKTVARSPSAHPFIIIGNGHAAWQMAINNTLSAGDAVLVLESGRFATIWGRMAELGGVEVEVIESGGRSAVDPARLEERLATDTGRTIKAVMTVLTDTASSVHNDIEAIGAALRAADHPALLMVDAIASLGCEPFEMERWGVDVTVAASQKGLMVPPGLGFVWAGPRALEAYSTAGLKDGYTDWGPRRNPEWMYQVFAGTPPIQHIWALAEALDMIDEEGGLEPVWRRHSELAGAVHAAVDAWSTGDGLEFNVIEPQQRSSAVTTIRTNSIDAEAFRARASDAAGLTLGKGIGDMAPGFRIGHMGHLNPPHILGTLGTIEATLLALGAPLGGSGIEAATRHLAGVF